MCFRVVIGVVLLAQIGAAQVPDTTRRSGGATVSGVVHDSIARMPLGGAVVQLVAADSLGQSGRTAVADAMGRFTITGVTAGRYLLGFFHPMLDSLGVEPLLRSVIVDGPRPVRADLAIPSAARLRAAICGEKAADSGAVVVGIARDSRDRSAAAGVTVSGAWLELSFTSGGIGQVTARRAATTAANGWFALCTVPSVGTIALRATRGRDSTDVIDVQIPAEGFLRRELYLGSLGEGRLSGSVVTTAGERPLASAQVSIAGGPQAAANERGEWTLVGAPAGTRMLDVRAVGYYPERRAVDVVAGAAPIRSSLSTMKAVLDTVRVTAPRQNDLNLKGFDERSRGGLGRFLTPATIERQRPIVTSDLFRMVPGLAVERSTIVGETELFMRASIGVDKCKPAVFVDGRYMSNLSADGIDDWVRPDEVAGIEIYAGPGVPPQFSKGMAGAGASGRDANVCGSIVIWTKLPPGAPSPSSWKIRVVKVAVIAAMAFGIAVLMDRR